MSNHLLHIDGIEEGHPYWRMTCEHAIGAAAWRYRKPDGSFTGDPTECWLKSWWDDIGAELVVVRVPVTVLPIPVRPDVEWDYESGGSLVYDDDGDGSGGTAA